MNEQSHSQWVSMPHAFKLFWINYANFKGRSSRSEYWWWYLWDQILHLPIYALLIAGLSNGMNSLVNIKDINGYSLMLLILSVLLNGLLGLVTIVPSLALLVRRMRDVGLADNAISFLIIAGVILWLLGIYIHIFYILLAILSFNIFIITLLPNQSKK